MRPSHRTTSSHPARVKSRINRCSRVIFPASAWQSKRHEFALSADKPARGVRPGWLAGQFSRKPWTSVGGRWLRCGEGLLDLHRCHQDMPLPRRGGRHQLRRQVRSRGSGRSWSRAPNRRLHSAADGVHDYEFRQPRISPLDGGETPSRDGYHSCRTETRWWSPWPVHALHHFTISGRAYERCEIVRLDNRKQ